MLDLKRLLELAEKATPGPWAFGRLADARFIAALNPETVKTLVERLLEAEALQWSPIETAPKDGTVVLVTEAGDDFVTLGMFDGERWNAVDHGAHLNAGVVMSPTHWMPLPSPPEAFLEGK